MDKAAYYKILNTTYMNNWIYFLATLIIGFCLPIMASSNGALSKSLGSPITSTFGIFVLSSVLLGLVVLFTKSPNISLNNLPNTNLKMWMGGCIVVINILTFSIAPQKIGVANMLVVFIAGQIISSIIVEHFGLLSFPKHEISLQRIVGVILIVAGVVLVKKF